MPNTRPALAGWYVISLRPCGAHDGLRRAARALGATVFALSPLHLVPLESSDLDSALAASRVLFTSPAAVRFAAAQRSLAARNDQHWLAVGAGTAAALQRHGIASARCPEHGANSEALLAMPELQRIAGCTVGLVTAPGGRGVIATTLLERGAALRVAEIYQRQPRRLPPARLQALLRLSSRTALMVSSGEALDIAWSQWPPGVRLRLQRQPAIASSPRLASQLQALGFVDVAVADDARPSSLLAALSRHAAALSLPVR